MSPATTAQLAGRTGRTGPTDPDGRTDRTSITARTDQTSQAASTDWGEQTNQAPAVQLAARNARRGRTDRTEWSNRDVRTDRTRAARLTRRTARAARRDALSGAGPCPESARPGAFPGATSKFALLAEIVLTGLLVTLGSVLIVTLPAALAAGAGHLRRHLKAEEASLKLFWSDFRAALPGGLAVGLGLVLASAATAFSLLLAAADGSVAGQIMRVLAGLVLLALATGTALAATDWTPSRGWARALKRLRPRFEQNPKAAAYTAGAVLAAALMTWMLYLLAVPALGLILFAAVAITETTRR